MPTRVVGIDGYKNGWVAIVLAGGSFHSALARPKVKQILDTLDDVTAVAIDIPIYPPDSGVRDADIAARKFLGRASSSVFTTPPRPVLHARDYKEARRIAGDLGIGVTAQAFALASKILEVDQLIASDPRIIEVHPEVSFRQLVGDPLPPKKT